MAPPTTVLAASETLLVEHFIESRQIAASTTVALRFGGSNRVALANAGAATAEFSTLDSDGRLPQNKIGKLSGVMVDFHSTAGTDEATRIAIATAIREMRAKCRVRLYVNALLIAEHPLAFLTSPGGVLTLGTGTAAAALMDLSNTGWPVAFGEHPIPERAQLWADIDSLAILTAAPVASSFRVNVAWQVKTSTLQVGRG